MRTNFFFLLIFPLNLFSQTEVSDTVFGIWTKANSPYHVVGHLVIPDDKSLTIEPGVLVEFQNKYRFVIEGQLIAEGAVEDSIVFTAKNKNTGWLGLRIHNGWEHLGGLAGLMDDNDTTRFDKCVFEYANSVHGSLYEEQWGGVLYVNTFHKVKIRNSVFRYNTAKLGGAINSFLSDIKIDGCVFHHNHGTSNAGAIEMTGTNMVISNSKFLYNSCGTGEGGGAVFIRHESGFQSVLYNNLFAFNSAENHGGALYFKYNANSLLVNNTIVFNESKWGGGFSCVVKSSPNFYNSIIYGNNGSVGRQIFLESGGDESDPNIYFSNLEGGKDSIIVQILQGATYTGSYQYNIDEDPGFVDPVNDFDLAHGSACINSGTLLVPDFELPEYDIEGQIRVEHMNIDMGAYEFQWEITSGDFEPKSNFKVNVFPNPFLDECWLEFSSETPEKLKISVFDSAGKYLEKFDLDLTQSKDLIFGETLTGGVFFLKIESNGKAVFKKIVKIK